MVQSTNLYPANVKQPTQGTANAVAINIFNPTAYGSAPSEQQAPYTYDQSVYNMPYTPILTPAANQYATQPMQYGYVPGYGPVAQPIAQLPTQPMQYGYVPGYTPVTQPELIAPRPQEMPPSVIEQPQAVAAPIEQPQVAQAPVEQPQVAEVAAQAPSETAQAPAEVQQAQVAEEGEPVNVDELVEGLKSADLEVRAEAINKIANYAQKTPETALKVVSEPIMQSLVNIINEDTSGYEGPSAEQIAVAEKLEKGEQLTPEEEKISDELCPRDLANTNRIFSLYTLAMLQKLQRVELDQYIENQKANGQEPIEPLGIQDLIGYNEVVNTIKNESIPKVKLAAIQALDHVAEPQDKDVIVPVLTEAQNSQDEAIKAAASEVLAKFAA